MFWKAGLDSSMKNLTVVLSFIVISILTVTNSRAQDNCANVVSEALSLYDVGRTAEMITRLNQCLPDGIAEAPQKVQAYRLLSFAYIAEDRLSEAQDAVEKLLDLNPNFEHDPTTDPPRFVEYVSASKDVRAQAQSKKSRKKRLLLIGGGTILAGALTAVIISSIGGTEPRVPLPDPPAFPDN